MGEPHSQVRRSQVFAWALWDWGGSAFNAVIVTFVFSVYLTDKVGEDLDGSVSASTWLGWSLGIAGLIVGVLAPAIGQLFDARAARKRSLGALSAVLAVTMLAMFFVEDSTGYLPLGLVLLGIGTITFAIAEVPYNAMLRQVSTPATVGRVSGFGWSMGYFGGIVLLLVCYTGFIAGKGETRGLLHISTADGLNIRLVAVLAAVWFALSAIPVLFAVPEPARSIPAGAKPGLLDAYRILWRDIRELWRIDRNTVTFLLASALFRDGLTAVFTFGAVLAVRVYGIADADVLLFGVAANVVAAIGALAAGRFDDRVGPKAVIVFALAAMLLVGLALFAVSGPLLFWIFGLLLCLFVGPAGTASRTYLIRLSPPGREGQMFGLYATTSRAVSFLAPALFGLFAFVSGSDRVGILGILVVLAAGLAVLTQVRPPVDRALAPEQLPLEKQ